MFSSLTVIDASTVLAGPSVGMFFAELGAKVIKVENPQHPDVTRSWKLASEEKGSSISAYFASINYKKEYRQLDLKNTDDNAAFHQLLKTADILLTNFKKGDDQKFNLTDEQLRDLYPQLIHGKISGFGTDSDRVAYDLILQAETGLMSMNGTPESGPVKMPVAFIDVLAAHQLKEGLLVALLEKNRTGKGKSVHVSLYDTAIASLVNQAAAYLMTGKSPERIGSLHPTIAPYGEIFETADKEQITFAIGSDSHFGKLVEFLKMEALAQEDKFIHNQNRVINRIELYNLLQAKISQFNASEILNWMELHFVPCGKIRNLEEVFSDQQAKSFVREEIINNQITKRVSTVAFQLW